MGFFLFPRSPLQVGNTLTQHEARYTLYVPHYIGCVVIMLSQYSVVESGREGDFPTKEKQGEKVVDPLNGSEDSDLKGVAILGYN